MKSFVALRRITVILLLSSLITSAANAQFSSAKITAAGLTCAMCTKAIFTSLKNLPFVESVNADISNSGFEVKLRDNGSVDIDKLKAAVEDAGFSVAKLLVTANVGNRKIEKDSHVEIGGKYFHFLNESAREVSGNQELTIVDKNFVTAKAFRKFSALTRMKCIQTGVAESCCPDKMRGKRIYHVTI